MRSENDLEKVFEGHRRSKVEFCLKFHFSDRGGLFRRVGGCDLAILRVDYVCDICKPRNIEREAREYGGLGAKPPAGCRGGAPAYRGRRWPCCVCCVCCVVLLCWICACALLLCVYVRFVCVLDARRG